MSNRLSVDIPVVEWPLGDAPWMFDTAQQIEKAVDAACRQCGYFFLKNHGVSAELIAATFEETRRFYSLSSNEKRAFKCSANSQFLGYRGVGAEKSLMHSGGEACEQYRIGNVVATQAAQVMAEFYQQPFREGTLLFEQVASVGSRIMSICATALGLPSTFFDRFMTAPMHRFGLNFYTVGSGRALGNAVNYAMTSHVDHAVMTILTQDEPGLQVPDANGEWIDVPVMPGALFVFLGDYMERWTNGLYRATRHQVREVARNRMSLQYKHRPSYAEVVAPLYPFVDESRPARYEPFDTGRQYTELLRSLLGE